MPELWQDELRHRQPDRVLRAGHADQDLATGCPRRGTTQHGRRANLLIAERPEQFAEPIDPFVEQRSDDLVGLVTRADTRAAGCDDDLDRGVGQLRFHDAAYGVGVIRNDGPANDLVATTGQQLDDRKSSRVSRLRPRVTDGHDKAPRALG